MATYYSVRVPPWSVFRKERRLRCKIRGATRTGGWIPRYEAKHFRVVRPGET
jgi:hypothetical protein